MAKFRASEMVEHVVNEALQIHSVNRYQQGYPPEYLYRLARERRLAAGNDEIQKNQLAAVLKQKGLMNLT